MVLVATPTVLRRAAGTVPLRVGHVVHRAGGLRPPGRDGLRLRNDPAALEAALRAWAVHTPDRQGVCRVCQAGRCAFRVRAGRVLAECGARPYLLVAGNGAGRASRRAAQPQRSTVWGSG